jgi:hypothetical protein
MMMMMMMMMMIIINVHRLHTRMHHNRLDFSRRVTNSAQRHLPDNTQHSQKKDIHAPGGIGIHNLSRRAAADPHLRPSGHWDRFLT